MKMNVVIINYKSNYVISVGMRERAFIDITRLEREGAFIEITMAKEGGSERGSEGGREGAFMEINTTREGGR